VGTACEWQPRKVASHELEAERTLWREPQQGLRAESAESWWSMGQDRDFCKACMSLAAGLLVVRLADSVILQVNDGFVAATDCCREQLVGKRASELGLWVDPKARVQWVEEFTAGQSIESREATFRRKSGDEFPGRLSITRVVIQEQYCTSSSVIDITERKRADRKTVERERPLRLLFDTRPQAVGLNEIVHDDSGVMVDYRVLQVNRAFYSTAD
jgi:PAS domain S-box-containing protein